MSAESASPVLAGGQGGAALRDALRREHVEVLGGHLKIEKNRKLLCVRARLHYVTKPCDIGHMTA